MWSLIRVTLSKSRCFSIYWQKQVWISACLSSISQMIVSWSVRLIFYWWVRGGNLNLNLNLNSRFSRTCFELVWFMIRRRRVHTTSVFVCFLCSHCFPWFISVQLWDGRHSQMVLWVISGPSGEKYECQTFLWSFVCVFSGCSFTPSELWRRFMKMWNQTNLSPKTKNNKTARRRLNICFQPSLIWLDKQVIRVELWLRLKIKWGETITDWLLINHWLTTTL